MGLIPILKWASVVLLYLTALIVLALIVIALIVSVETQAYNDKSPTLDWLESHLDKATAWRKSLSTYIIKLIKIANFLTPYT